MRDYKEICGIIADLEASFPVTRLTYGDVPLWPIIRQQVANALFWEDRPARSPLRARVARAVPSVPARFAHSLLHRSAGRSARKKIAGQSDVLFATAGFEYVPLMGALYNKFLDPIKELLDARGVGHADIELGFEGRDFSPKHSPTIDLRPEVQLTSRAALIGTPGFARRDESQLAAFADHARSRMGLALDLDGTINRAANVSTLSRLFDGVLDAVRPKVCMFVCYYQDTTMALAHAARKRGVKTVELQHSVVAEYDWNWCKWSAIPEGGFTIMPDLFWSWGEKYSNMLDCWQRRPNTNLAPRVGGNLWIWKWRRSAGSTIPEATARLAAPAPGKTILYTVPYGDAKLMPEWFPPELEEAIRQSPTDWIWHVRLHYKSDAALVNAVRDHAARLGPNVRVHHADEHALFHLFGIADIHMSQTSTTTLEAEAFGVPNLIIGEIGRDWYRKEIDSGAYHFASTAHGILSFVKEPGAPTTSSDPAMVTDASRAEALLDELQLV